MGVLKGRKVCHKLNEKGRLTSKEEKKKKMPEYNYVRGKITDFLQFIATEIKEFEEDYIFKSWKDYKKDRKLQKLMELP